MEPEDRLEALLSARERRRTTSDASLRDGSLRDESLAPLVAAADRLGELRRAEPAPGFARALGDQLLARTEHLRRAGEVQALGAEQRADRIGTQTASRHTPGVALRPAPGVVRRPFAPVPLRSRLLRPALAAAAVVALACGVTTYAAEAQVGPDNPLYFVQRQVQSVQVQLAPSQADRARLHLEYANQALSQADSAAQHHDDGGYATSLSTLTGELGAAKQTLSTVPAGSDHDALAAQLAALQSQARHDLAANLAGVNWRNRVNTTTALGALGVTVPRVTSATVVRLGLQGDGQGGNQGDGHGDAPHGDQVTVTGSGFATGAVLVVDGHAAQAVTVTVGPQQFVAVVSDASAENAGYIGIANPDGTAAQTSSISVQNAPGNGGNGNGGTGGDNGSDHHPGATPTPVPTATPDHGHGHGP